jgi:ankyrin repeat protein
MDEIACLRLLLWAGFDPNARNDSGNTALIYMASLRTRLVSHPRAIRLLLGVGANPNLTNKTGDTALCYLSGNKNWFAAHTVAAWQLLDGGANPFVKANDGECAYSMWQRHKQGSKDIEGILAAVDGFAAQRYGVFAKC